MFSRGMAAFVADHVSRNQTPLICARSPSPRPAGRGAERGARCPPDDPESAPDKPTAVLLIF
eukprot:1023260-Prymnesium_polylepis.1